MTDGTVRSHAQGMAPDRVLAATGRSPDEWHALIDGADGTTIGHAAIASWLIDQGVEPWWAQGITIGYEQARGLRIPGQRTDGTFAVSASRQVPGEREAVLDRIVPVFTAALGSAPTSGRRGGKRPSARWTFPDRESVLLTTEDGPRPDTVRISVQRERLTGPERMPDAKAELQRLLAGL
ncbi:MULTISPECIES: hypothetical protein [Curtobacterium]|uniref:hypothetical protein n=1 Tax=Curtobacterium TaxID=2034 RepID=UPI0015F47FAD|nr:MULTISPECIES: hypothetical protein [Curtobacterium]MBO9039913.1 hypothetical protein [Curtobacterium flaccumfaciens pv. flaccumfaciens]MCA5922617.1 DUF4287 domain-containing protein [Curtobacterium oceanosedimentum]MDT0231967.1 hypothetical protein [Curtobacterium sp. BRB10]QQD75611.1 hypothetical protein I8920_12410 [Curtobacterium sp. YC1]